MRFLIQMYIVHHRHRSNFLEFECAYIFIKKRKRMCVHTQQLKGHYFNYAKARCICRNSNNIARELAHQAKRSGEESKWIGVVPESLANLCRLEGI